ncbi:MarR family winged helix-turn-helix transcriptional regulator [Serratia rhizosphaerae]|uniref:MarR family transcriptional regulator n=2 Tax=Serratia rhizosphaerae TaxID=2597702 RepID=A0ABX6GIQ2_9GAMM|nr:MULTISPECIES: MarR family transcriptional regulator [Serratia]MBU3894114.1 MarR family transcriptional regulator [Serratia rubidaea]AVJ16741.1 MarR family transcriptional regulator [Serratia sp. MYb239]MCA4823258.1 MarR family transcriptional regulator [Serratia rubidaea]QHA86143.1 MarR family transcriptional regulator [Serratia rhizosphaerae]QNK31324.1 MarR family transcriptional regulator [Serratia sp. JUb9]
MGDQSPITLDKLMCFAVYSTNLALNRVYQPLLDEMGLTYPQYLVLILLLEQDGLTVGEISERLFIDASTTTPLLKRLESHGYVVRVRSSEDQRQVHVRVTPQARQLREGIDSLYPQLLCSAGLDETRLRGLKQELEAVRSALTAR